MTNHLAHTARELYDWLGSSLPTDVSLIGKFLENGSARRLSDGCPIRSSKSEWGDNPKAGGFARLGLHSLGITLRDTSSEHCFHIIHAHVKDFRDDIIAAMRL